MTQKEKVLKYLKEKGEATRRDMIIDLWINCPEKQVEILRRAGENIKTVHVRNNLYKYVWCPK